MAAARTSEASSRRSQSPLNSKIEKSELFLSSPSNKRKEIEELIKQRKTSKE